MDLYDDVDTKRADGWSSGIKMLQTQLAIKKAKPLKDSRKPLMTPVVNLRTKKVEDAKIIREQALEPHVLENIKTNDWDFVDEYDPQWPNEYDKLKDKQERRQDKPSGRERKRNRGRDRDRDRSPPQKFGGNLSGFGQRPCEEDTYSPTQHKNLGAAIAPPPSLQEISINNDTGDGSSNVTIPYSASSVAAKIMAKYGFKDGQGLGKQEQGMSMALQVEKTSKRGGRIIHHKEVLPEKDVFLPPPSSQSPPPSFSMGPPAPLPPAAEETPQSSEPSITEIMKEPSKVVLLRNMVGPGDVDEELEPEVKDECNTKYGEVASVIIHEIFGTVPEEAVKIYVEFKRIESAIKAVVDLNGRFFGGRQVRAGFFNYDKFKNFQLT